MGWWKMAKEGAKKSGGMVVGNAQAVEGMRQTAKAIREAPALTDPTQATLLTDTLRSARQAKAGTDALTQANLQEAEQNTAATQRGLAGVTGGNTSATISAMLGAQKLGGQVINQTFGAASNRAVQQQQFADTLSKEISQRKLELQLAKSGQSRALGAQFGKMAFSNLSHGNFDFGKKEGGDKKEGDKKMKKEAGNTDKAMQDGAANYSSPNMTKDSIGADSATNMQEQMYEA